ncbi:MAG: hypothetical protein JRJ17_03160 [Deltaproteobacteria bacterium]|nr:hypothetical protein [Deltaproteobacteria bacterium]
MSDYLKHLYEGIGEGLLSKWAVVYPVLSRAGLVLLGALLIWVIFRRVMGRVRKRAQKYEFVRINDQIFDLIQKAVLYAIIFISGIYLLNLFRIICSGFRFWKRSFMQP